MNKKYSLISLLASLIITGAGCSNHPQTNTTTPLSTSTVAIPTPTSPTVPHEKILVGMWQDRPHVADTYSNLYYFFADGRFSFVPSQTDCTTNIKQIDGDYRLENGSLHLHETLELQLDNQFTIKDPDCPNGKRLDPNITTMIEQNTPEKIWPIAFSTSTVTYLQGQEDPGSDKIEFNQTSFWKIGYSPDNDPEAPVPIGSNVKADDYK